MVAENQRLIGAELDKAGAAVNLGWHHGVGREHRRGVKQACDAAGARADAIEGKALSTARAPSRSSRRC